MKYLRKTRLTLIAYQNENIDSQSLFWRMPV